MDYIIQHKRNEAKDRTRSAIITLLISLVLFLGIFFYKFTKITEQPEQLTTMLINFGDNRDGAEIEEPANQEGSLAANSEVTEPVEEIVPEAKPEPVKELVKPAVKEKIITGTNTKVSAPKVEKVVKAKTPTKSTPAKTTTPKKATPAKATTPNSNTGSGDGKGTAAVGNLLKGRGTKVMPAILWVATEMAIAKLVSIENSLDLFQERWAVAAHNLLIVAQQVEISISPIQ